MITKETFNNDTIFHLSNEIMDIFINPYDGMNLYEIRHCQKPIVKFYKDRLQDGKTCSVMTLFPTPNRTRNMEFKYDGCTYQADNHGFIRHGVFTVEKTTETPTGGIIRAFYDINQKKHPNYPFLCKLYIEIELSNAQIIYRYTVENMDTKTLPYGIAIHPFFEKQDESVTISVFADHRMEASPDHLPTGQLLPVEGTFDLRYPTEVNTLTLDDVYTTITKQPCAQINYPDKKITLQTSPEFKKIVVFTPENSPFFCIENQTCSTDAINLYHQGLHEESSLLFVEPNHKKSGYIILSIAE